MRAIFATAMLLLVTETVHAQQPGANLPAKPATLRVAAVQMRSSRDLGANLQRIEKYLRDCAVDGIRVAVFPECALTGYFEGEFIRQIPAADLNEAFEAIASVCSEAGIYGIVGTPYHENGKLYNSALVFTPSGRILERYHKVQLAEKWPDAGDHLSVFPIDGIPCSIIVCHDERYPELVRLPVLAGARVVFYVSHESGMKEEQKVNPYRAQIQARAAENSVFIVHANAPANNDLTGSHGQSRIIAPDGNLTGEATIFREEVVTANLDLKRATGNLAKNSVVRGPLGDWWREGVRQVRIIEP